MWRTRTGTGCVFESHGGAGCAAGGMRHRGGFLQRRACSKAAGAACLGFYNPIPAIRT